MAKGQVIREIPSLNQTDYKFLQVSASAIENGMILGAGALVTGARDVYVGSAIADVSAADEFWIATGVELQYDERLNRDSYENAAGKPFRAERVKAGITIAVSKDVLTFATDETTNMVVGALACAVDAATKIKLEASAATDDIAIGVVRDVFTRGGTKYASIEFYHD